MKSFLGKFYRDLAIFSDHTGSRPSVTKAKKENENKGNETSAESRRQ